MSGVSALIDIYKMTEVSVEARIRLLHVVGEIVNWELGTNATEPLVKELVDLLNSDNVPYDKWIPVSERMPDNWESVLTIDISKSTRDMVTAFYNPETSLWSTHFSMYSDSDLWVTHWMPLPESPIVYGKERE